MFTLGFVSILSLIMVSMFGGIFITLFLQWYFLNKFLLKQPLAPKLEEPVVQDFKIPKSLLERKLEPEPAIALNALFQFLFQECKNTERVRRWFRSRLSLELEELLTRTTTGKLFDAIALRELNLGTEFPNIAHIEVKQLNVNSENGLIDDLELCLELNYNGGFQLSIDANMRLSKTARVSVKVDELKGQGCLRFTRHPYTHWCFSFYPEPQLHLSVESQFQGRALPQINSIIASQIRKALKRKHTLPNYNIRYKPFFHRKDPGGGGEEGEAVLVSGILEVTVLQVSRLTETSAPVYCSLAVDSIAWVEMVHYDSASFLTVDLSVPKQGNSLGIQFKQEFVADKYQVCFVVESVASWVVVEVRVGDILVAVDGKTITSLAQINKFVRLAGDKVPLRLERKLKILPAPTSDDKLLDITGLRHRRGSGEKTDSDSSTSTSLSDSPAKKTLRESPEHKVIHRLSFGSEMEQQQLEVLTSKEQLYSQVINFNEVLKFNILPEHKFLNVSVWGKGERNTLLGHVSLPLSPLCVFTVGHHVNTYSLLPPLPHLINNSTDPLSSHHGFEPCLCYGDVLLSTCFTASRQTTSTTSPVPSPNTSLSPPSPFSPVSSAHDFERTHFSRTTQCGFCFKKIWLKDAFRCRGCAMTCHKKCVTKCLSLTSCGRRASVQPEIVTTVAEDLPTQTDDKSSEQTSLGDENNLFSLIGDDEDEISTVINLLLSRPYDEELMDQAKTSGRHLFAHLVPEQRKKRIDTVITKIKNLIDEESETHTRLVHEEQSADSAESRGKATLELTKSEEKLHVLTALMLHCCAGLQDSHDSLSVPSTLSD